MSSYRFGIIAICISVMHDSGQSSAPAAEQPNILYIMADDHAATAIGAYNRRLSDIAPTAHIDRIAREGMRLNNVFCNNSICTPSRASIITGQYSHVNGIYTLRGRLQPESASFPRELQKAGYQTAVIGKWHIQSTPRFFDHYEVLPGQGAYFNPKFSRNGKNTRYEGHCTDVITELCLEWLKQREAGKPFFLMCHHKAPHGKWEYAPRFENLLADVDVPPSPTIHDAFQDRSNALKVHHRNLLWHGRRMTASAGKWPTGNLDVSGMSDTQIVEAAYQKYVKEYLRCVAGVDEGVGRLLGYLDDEGLVENTIVIYTSDQGMFLGEHGYIDKRLILEESLRMPFLVRFPGRIAAGSQNDAMIVNVDFGPTILDFAGATIPDAMQGRSFRSLLEGQSIDDWRTSMFYAYWGGPTKHYGVRTTQHKLIVHHTGERDLFDLAEDPLEIHSRIDDPAYSKIRSDLEAELANVIADVGIEEQDLPGQRNE